MVVWSGSGSMSPALIKTVDGGRLKARAIPLQTPGPGDLIPFSMLLIVECGTAAALERSDWFQSRTLISERTHLINSSLNPMYSIVAIMTYAVASVDATFVTSIKIVVQ